MLWVDKYRPKYFDGLVYHKTIGNALNTCIENKKINHMIFYGPPGSGKNTLINCILYKLYGSSIDKILIELNPVIEKENRKIPLNLNILKNVLNIRESRKG